MVRNPARPSRLLISAHAVACLIALFLIVGCHQVISGATQVGSLAFTRAPFGENTVYVSESGTLVPYLVLSNDYSGSGKTLLLREHVMDEPRYYDENSQGNGYYAGSMIDAWLNGEYLSQLDAVEAAEVPLKISKKGALGHCGLEVEIIERRAFLLSWLEVGGPEGVTIAPDGTRLEYFATHEAAATKSDGVFEGYMLRSAATCYNTMYLTVGANGQFGGGGLDRKGGVRPAFCVESSTQIEFVEHGGLGRVPVLS